jgi:hypothetical protein
MKLLKFNPNASTEGNSSSSRFESPVSFLLSFTYHLVAIPQILIDGIPIGNETSLQDLEEDTYLGTKKIKTIVF